MNDVSAGVKKRNSQDFPAAGLRWLVKFKAGENVVRAVGKNVQDEIRFVYQTEKWDKPAKLVLKVLSSTDKVATVEAHLVDAKGVLCLDTRNVVRFGLAGDGRLIDNLGTSTTARKVELYNGRAQISVEAKETVVVSVSSEGLPTAVLNI